MKIAFVPKGCLPFHGKSLEERPLGGTESSVIYLAKELHDLGHQVIVFTTEENPPPSDPPYAPYSAIGQLQPVDALISVREWIPLIVGLPARKRFFTTGDSYDQPQNFGLGDKRVAERIDAFLSVTEWHADTICELSGFPREKSWKVGYGVDLAKYSGSEERVRKRLIYTSTPYRGLAHLPPLYLEIKERHPDAELHVFSGYKVYYGKTGYNPQAEQEWLVLKAELEKLPDCVVHGNVMQSQLAREFMKSAVLAYPNTFEETCCITIMEAHAAGCAVVTTALGALPETVGGVGVTVEGTPGEEEYSAKFVDAVDKIFSDDAYFNELSEAGMKRAREVLDWKLVAKRFENYLREEHGLE